MLFSKNGQKGFTLVEIIVVITIIGILVSLGSVGYANYTKRARDTKRKEDIHHIQNALEQYYALCGYIYPTPQNYDPVTNMGEVPDTIGCNGKTLIETPHDPAAGNPPYIMKDIGTPEGTSYTVCSDKIEFDKGATEYCVKNKQ